MRRVYYPFYMCFFASHIFSAEHLSEDYFLNNYTVECNHPGRIEKLPKEDIPIWHRVCNAIYQDSWSTFSKEKLAALINKVHTTNAQKPTNLQEYKTLIELLVFLGTTENREKMIRHLCRFNLHTQSSYTVFKPLRTCKAQDERIHLISSSVSHEVPIYYAIIKGNTPAFKALWHSKETVIKGEDILTFLTTYKNNPENRGLEKQLHEMLAYAQNPTDSSGCFIQ